MGKSRYRRRHDLRHLDPNALWRVFGMRGGTSLVVGLWIGLSVALVLLPASSAIAQEHGWVRGGIRINLRAGAGTQFKVLGVVTTGDGVTIVERTKEWTRIRTAGNKTGWIPVGYLKPEPPPTLRLENAEAEVESLKGRIDELLSETQELITTNEGLSSRDGRQREQIEALTFDNLQLRAGARYPEWIAGASIFAAGMIVGAMLHRNATRRPSSRIRL